MKRKSYLALMLCATLGIAPMTAMAVPAPAEMSAPAPAKKISGTVVDDAGNPVAFAAVHVKGTSIGTNTDTNGKFTINAAQGSVLEVSFIGYTKTDVKVTGAASYQITLKEDSKALGEVVVTAMGIKKEKKALGYSIDEINSEELMKNKSNNIVNSLSGKIAGVSVTQSSGAAGAGSQIILRGGTTASEGKDNQPLFVVDGIIYDNSSSVIGNSAFDGSGSGSTTTSNRVMDINPEDIENISVLKGPAAAALYGSRAANGVILITTKKGKKGNVEVNYNAKYTTSWASSLPKTQKTFKRGYMEDLYDGNGEYTETIYNDQSYNSWGEKYDATTKSYDNIGNFFNTAGIWDHNLSVSGGTDNSSFYLSGSYYDQDGIVPETGYDKTTFRFNGEQKWKMLTFGVNAAYSQANTTRTLTGAGLYNSQGTGALYAVYNWSPTDDMTHYLNEDGSRYRMFGNTLDPWEERDNPYWIVNKNKMTDRTERFTGNFNIKADITKWWWVSFREGVDTYTQEASNRIAPNGAIKQVWQNGMMSDNSKKYRYISTNLMSNFSHKIGDFGLNLMLGTSTDYYKSNTIYMMAYNFQVPEFYSYENASNDNKQFKSAHSTTRQVSGFGEFRADWKNAVFFTYTGRNDWNSTLPKSNRSYFYSSYSGAVVLTELLKEQTPDWLTFAKLRASWAKVGKGTGAYETNTYSWPVGTYLNGTTGLGNSWTRGNPYLKPEITKSTELGLELHFLQNRLKLDVAYYTNDSYNQILSPRGPQSTGYIFCSINAGNVYNKGYEISVSGTPIKNKNFSWETGINLSHNQGTMDGLPTGMEFMYVTDVQYASAKAASISGGSFMAITGTQYKRVSNTQDKQWNGKVILDANGMPTQDNTTRQVGDREYSLSGGWNNTLTYKNWSLNMLWEFRLGGDVFNGTKYAMTMSGTSKFSGEFRTRDLVIKGVQQDGTKSYEVNGKTVTEPVYKDVTYTFSPDKTYQFNGKTMSGYNIIENYYTTYYNYETSNWITKVNSLRLRSISLSYDTPKEWLAKHLNFVKRCTFTATATNLLLFTNYDGDPECAAAGAGRGGSSSVGFDYCGVPATSSFSFGVNLSF